MTYLYIHVIQESIHEILMYLKEIVLKGNLNEIHDLSIYSKNPERVINCSRHYLAIIYKNY